MKKKEIESFLKFGYNLSYKNKSYSFNFKNVEKNIYKNISENELINIGKDRLIKAFSNIFENNKKHVVPLSGGLDSRAILAVLLEFTNSSNIYTYTFGVPGSLDFDIGNIIADDLGTNHKSYNLTNYEYSLENLIEFSKMVDGQTLLFHSPPIEEIKKRYSNGIIWSGFMGDPLAGGHLNLEISDEITLVKENFIKNNEFVKSISLNSFSNKEFYPLIEIPKERNPNITLKEQVDFYNRQLKYVAPHILMNGFDYKTPFLESVWSDFILSVPNQYRENENLYKKILLNLSPYLFGFSTKTNYGAKLNDSKLTKLFFRVKNKFKQNLSKFSLFTNPYLNYIDFDKGIRKRSDLNKIVYSNIMDLQKRNIINCINIDEIWENHIDKKINHADALLVLASIEINLKASKY